MTFGLLKLIVLKINPGETLKLPSLGDSAVNPKDNTF